MSTSITTEESRAQSQANYEHREKLKTDIREENTKARSLARKSLEHVRTCGEKLIELKSLVDHGMWLSQLRDLRIERKTASNYMRIATEWETVSHLNGGVRDALKLLARGEEPPPSKPSPTSSPARSSSPPPVTLEAEIVAPEARVDELEAVVVDGTQDVNDDDPIDPEEPLFKAIKKNIPEANPDPIYHAIERLIFILLNKKCDADYINGLCDGVIQTEAAAGQAK